MSQSPFSSQTDAPTLVFPGGMARSLEFLETCLATGRPVIGASSLDFDVAQSKYPSWLKLPYVTESAFDSSLAAALSRFGIKKIFTPNLVIWEHLNRTLEALAPGVELANASPSLEALSPYRAASRRVAEWSSSSLNLASRSAMRHEAASPKLAALVRHTELIPGMCPREKIEALCALARCVPSGDLVEIGSWWGKSAFLLAGLAQIYDLGALLCVDPWENQHLIQADGTGLVDQVSAQHDCEEALEIFKMNLLPYANGKVNFLRMPSVDGRRKYGVNAVHTEFFGHTSYSGHIALLHVDGNHRYDAAKADLDAWSGAVVAGGWIVIDDYLWPYGKGPKQVGDEYLRDHADRIETAFVMGGALFLQKALA